MADADTQKDWIEDIEEGKLFSMKRVCTSTKGLGALTHNYSLQSRS